MSSSSSKVRPDFLDCPQSFIFFESFNIGLSTSAFTTFNNGALYSFFIVITYLIVPLNFLYSPSYSPPFRGGVRGGALLHNHLHTVDHIDTSRYIYHTCLTGIQTALVNSLTVYVMDRYVLISASHQCDAS